MKTLHLVRHGQASWHGEDYDDLTELGRRQSTVVGEALAERRISPDQVVSGALRRQRDTAELASVAAGWSAERQVDERWAEFDHVDLVARFDPAYRTHGDLARALAETDGDQLVSRLMVGSMARWVAAEGEFAETFSQFTDRVGAAADDLLSRLDDGQVAVVFTSGGVIGALALRALDGPPEQWVRLAISANGAVSTFVELESGLALGTLNDHAHLEIADLVTFSAKQHEQSTAGRSRP